MKGLFFNLLEGFVAATWDQDAYEGILSASPLQTRRPFVGPLTYPDGDLVALVTTATARLGVPRASFLSDFGKYCFPRLAAKLPRIVQGHTHARTFLESLDEIVHADARQRFKDARPPRIVCEDLGPDAIALRYESMRGLCPLFCGLLDGAAEHFRTPLRHEQIRCADDGADACEIHVTFSPKAVA